MMQWRRATRLAPVVPAAVLGGCSGVQSVLSPIGVEAQRIDPLLLTSALVGVVVTLVVTVLIALALYGPRAWRARLSHEWIIIGGGIVFPVIVLSALLTYGFMVMQAGAVRHGAGEGLTVTIIGKRWWWEVIYTTGDGREIVSANELRLPAGKPVRVLLESDNVIHSFWAPRLAGKLDMIPGRTNEIVLEVSEPGISRGQCAEYCGGPHALMAFYVVVMPQGEYEDWLAHEAQPAAAPEGALERRGHDAFFDYGCGACHTVRGTRANGEVGPDLTHVGGRLSLGAGTLANDRLAFIRWISQNQHIKPDNLMPPFRLPEGDLAALAAYLNSLE